MHSPWQAPSPDLQSRIQTLSLYRGQTCHLWLAAGSQLLCQAPSIQITESPQWQLERLVSRCTRLADGERLVLEQAGWVELHAREGGQLLCLAPPRPRWQLTLGNWLRRLRQRSGWRAAHGSGSAGQ